MASLRAFTMPKWGIEMTQGLIAEWLVPEGVPFKRGDIIAVVETDKITNDIEAEADGVFPRLLAKAGETYRVGELLAVLASDGDASSDEVDTFIDGFTPAGGKPAPSSPASQPAAASTKVAQPPSPSPVNDDRVSPASRQLADQRGIDLKTVAGSGRNSRITFQDVHQAGRPEIVFGGEVIDISVPVDRFDGIFASPLAKRLARLHGIDLTLIDGTGPRGRICKADVLSLVEPDIDPIARSGAVEVIAMSPMRKAIARALTLSKSTIPHFYLRCGVRIDPILALREQAKAATGEAPTINDYVVRACALALVQHPDVNVQVHGDEIHRFRSADVSVAVATEKGLITPIVRNAETLSVAALSREVKRLADLARRGRLQPEDFQGGSFSVSNLGMFGIEQFDAIINPPQAAILAIGAGHRQPIETGHALAFATIVQLSLSCDHRAIDGAVGAAFMRTLKTLIQDPARLAV